MNYTRIMFWNCQGVNRKRLELLNLVQEKKIDIILLNETHLSSNKQFKLPNFITYSTNKRMMNGRPPAGGTAILINRKFSHLQVKILTNSITNTTIQLRLGQYDLRLISVYKSPKSALQIKDIENLLDSHPNVIIAGDLNAKHGAWNSRKNNQAGKILNEYLNTRIDTTVAAPSSPTRYPTAINQSPDILDIAIMKTGNIRYIIENLTDELSSDHTPILLDISLNSVHTYPPKPQYVTNWELFEQEMENQSFPLPKMSSEIQIDSAINQLSSIITEKLEKSSFIFSTQDRKNDLPIFIQNHIRKKRKLRAAWQRSRDPDIKKSLNKHTALVRELLHSHMENEWTSFLGSIDNNAQGWSKLHKLNKRLLRNPPPVHPLQDQDGNLQYDPETNANIFAQSMEEQFKTPDTHCWVDEVVRDSIDQHDETIYKKSIFFSPGEIHEIIRRLPNKSSPGPDKISNCALKHGGKKFKLYLCQIYNACARLEYFPNSWKIATIVMLPKPGKDPKHPTNHRPISLLNTMGKVLEKLLLSRLKIYIMPKIRPEQYGFRSEHSTTIQLINVIDLVSNDLNIKRKTAATFLDIQKAFDKVWHEGLIFKLLTMDISHQLINLLRSFLLNRSFQVKIGNSLSTPRAISAGVPQGSCLSPHLFSVYINDMPKEKEANIALFADDTVFFASGTTNNAAISRVQRQIDLALPWFKQWKISLNPSKTQAIMFTNRSTHQSNNLHFENTAVLWSNSVKYLGVTIDNKLKFAKHLNSSIQKATGAKFSLFPLINKLSPLPVKTKLYIYKTYIKPIILYASPSWTANISKTSWTKLETFQSKTLRMITGSDWYVSNHTIRSSLNVLSIKDSVNLETNKTFQRIKNSNYEHLSNIVNRKHHKEIFRKRPLSLV